MPSVGELPQTQTETGRPTARYRYMDMRCISQRYNIQRIKKIKHTAAVTHKTHCNRSHSIAFGRRRQPRRLRASDPIMVTTSKVRIGAERAMLLFCGLCVRMCVDFLSAPNIFLRSHQHTHHTLKHTLTLAHSHDAPRAFVLCDRRSNAHARVTHTAGHTNAYDDYEQHTTSV